MALVTGVAPASGFEKWRETLVTQHSSFSTQADLSDNSSFCGTTDDLCSLFASDSEDMASLSSDQEEDECMEERAPQVKDLRIRYLHLENALVFLKLAVQLISSSRTPVENMHAFRGASVESSLLQFGERLAYGMRCKYPCYVLALIYLGKLSSRSLVRSDTFERLVIASVMVAVKYYDDLYYSNEHYARELMLPLEALNVAETQLLLLLDFQLTAPEYRERIFAFDRAREEHCREQNVPVFCGLGTSRLSPSMTQIITARNQSVADLRPDMYVVSEPLLHRREWRGTRYESEEEFLNKSSIENTAKAVKKLISQYQDELRKNPPSANITLPHIPREPFSLAVPRAAWFSRPVVR